MARVMPSRVVEVIDQLFPHAAKGLGVTGPIFSGKAGDLQGILSMVEEIPPELVDAIPDDQYPKFVLALSATKVRLGLWISRGTGPSGGELPKVGEVDVVTVIRRVLEQCPDEVPARSSTELAFILDPDLRDSLRRDYGAAYRALNNAEWKAATVLAGATIEALLHWRLHQPPEWPAAVSNTARKLKKSVDEVNHWGLGEFIAVAGDLQLIKAETVTASGLAQNFRNLIHPGRAQRKGQVCDRGTAHSAIGALEHVIRDLS